ncbi:MAG: hypothetical protein ACREBR_05125 [bacterium]
MADNQFNDAQSKPGLTADGVKWYQNCYVCNKQINFFKAPKESWRSVGQYVRHMKCYPPPLK